MKVWINGKMVDRESASVSVFDHGLLYGDGIFEGIRVYGGRIFQCTAHMDRLFQSAELIRLPMPYSRDELIEAMEACIAVNGLTGSGYIRLVVTRGAGTLGLHPFRCENQCVFIIADQLSMYDQTLYDEGMKVILCKTVRVNGQQIPSRVKSLNYLNNILGKIECIDAGVLEGIMLNTDGMVAEATGDNVFLVRDGRLLTPPPDASILLGVTRNVVLHLARRLGIEAEERPIAPDELLAAEECFLTGTGAEMIAVTQIDDTVIGEGTPGAITQRLLDAFRKITRTGEEFPYTA